MEVPGTPLALLGGPSFSAFCSPGSVSVPPRHFILSPTCFAGLTVILSHPACVPPPSQIGTLRREERTGTSLRLLYGISLVLSPPSRTPFSISVPCPTPLHGFSSLLPTAIAAGGHRCGLETWAATALPPTSSSPSSATCTPKGARAHYSLQPNKDHATSTFLQYSGPARSKPLSL